MKIVNKPNIIIFLGIYFLMNNLGIFTLDLGDVASKFWPIILILVGVSYYRPDQKQQSF